PYSYGWYSAAECPSESLISGASSSTYLASPSSTTTYSYKITDSSSGTPSASQCSLSDIITVNPTLAAGAISPSGPTIDSGQSITLTSHASGGTPPLLYQWYSDSSCQAPLPGTTSSTYTASPTTTTSYSYKVTDSAYSPETLCSGGDLVTVSLTLFAGDITPSTPAIDSGQTITLSANPSGGTTPYHYQWYQSASQTCPSGNPLPGTASTLSVSPASNTYYCYTVTDSSTGSPAPSATSPATSVNVNPALVAGLITPSNPTIDNGQGIVLTANPLGGTTPYHYQWYSDGTC